MFLLELSSEANDHLLEGLNLLGEALLVLTEVVDELLLAHPTFKRTASVLESALQDL